MSRSNHSVVKEAESFAREAHGSIGQVRKYTGEPYAVHLAAVADLVSRTPSATEAMVAAAWLHDVLEDVPSVSIDHIEVVFGPEIAAIVLQLTNVSRPEDGNRATRKAKDRDHLAQASPEAQTIKLADLLDNASSILAHDRAFAKVFLREMGELLAVLTKGDAELQKLAMMYLEDGLRYQ